MHNIKNKILIAYYSYTGNTKIIAEKIKKIINGDLYEIKTIDNYPKDTYCMVQQTKEEKAKNFKPKLQNNININNYNIIFIGTPIWNCTMASPIRSFINYNNLDNKIIIPFCTYRNGGKFYKNSFLKLFYSNIKSTVFVDIEKMLINSKLLQSIEIYDNEVKNSDKEIKKWIKSLNL